jgi:hypothetical protein
MYDRLLEIGSQDLPDCACGQEMGFLKTRNMSPDVAVKHFECSACGREMLLTVWPESVAPNHIAQ